jgi:hypothetical protein
MVEEVFVIDYLSMWSWAKLLPIAEKRSSNQVILKWMKIMSFYAFPRLSLQVLILSCSYLKALPQKYIEEKISHGYSSQNSIFRNSYPFVGYTLYWIFILWFSSL